MGLYTIFLNKKSIIKIKIITKIYIEIIRKYIHKGKHYRFNVFIIL